MRCVVSLAFQVEVGDRNELERLARAMEATASSTARSFGYEPTAREIAAATPADSELRPVSTTADLYGGVG